MNTTAKTLFTAVLVATVIGLAAPQAEARKGGPSMVVFNASWCASCRNVVPIAQNVAQQNSLGVAVIDVDAQDAPAQAADYGLSIPKSQPPQVYFVNGGKVTLLYDGSQYRYGQDDAVRADILNRLKQ